MKNSPSVAAGRPSILVVEDDAHLRVGLCDNLRDEGYAVAETTQVRDAERLMQERAFDLLVLDVMLPGEDGYGFCRRLRSAGVTLPVLMLTARSLEEDIVLGFEAGAQDYLTKPYRIGELLARVKALLKRSGTISGEALHFGGFVLNPTKRSVESEGGKAIELTRTEFDLLAYLLRNRDRAITRDEILNAVWGTEVVVDPRTVDNFISNLKKKLEWSPNSGFVIHTIRGVGYRMELEAMTKP